LFKGGFEVVDDFLGDDDVENDLLRMALDTFILLSRPMVSICPSYSI
jgi:hypothetical protein